MSIEILRSIRQTEFEADEIKKKAADECRRIVSEANEKALELVENAQKEAEAKAIDLISQAETEANNEKKKLLEQVNGECAALKAEARLKLDKVADIIIGRIVKAHGNS